MSRCPTCRVPSRRGLGWACALGDWLEDAVWCATPWYVPRLPVFPFWALTKLCWRIAEPPPPDPYGGSE